jgi:hypothetical protein
MGLVAMPARFADRKLAFLDLGGKGGGLMRRRSLRVIIGGRFDGTAAGAVCLVAA